MKKILLLFTITILFVTVLTGCETNYSNDSNWLITPTISDTYPVDVIYYYPTAFESKGNGEICTINNESMRTTAKQQYDSLATTFETVGNMYVPYYRQVAASDLEGKTQREIIESESSDPKYDVFASLDYYFEHFNQGKPFILAGHSQGSMMVYLILDEYLELHPEHYKNMIAAYMIGTAPTSDWLSDNPHLKMAQEADDTGVIVSWNTEGPDNLDQYTLTVPDGALYVDPLNWSTYDTHASAEENIRENSQLRVDTYLDQK